MSPKPCCKRRQPAVYGLILVPVLFFAGFSLVFLHDAESSQWNYVYVYAAQDMVEGQPIHDAEPNLAYAYPPAMAMLAAPLASFSPATSLMLWYAVNVVAACIAFTLAWRLAGGPRFFDVDLRWFAILILATFVSLRYFIAPLENRQFDMVIAAALMAGAYALWHGRDNWAAVGFGVAAAMKLTPLLFAPYLAWRRKYVAAVLLVVVAVGVNLLPDAVWPQTNGNSYLADFGRVFLAPVADAKPGQWHSDILLNQSLAGFVGRHTSGLSPDARWPKLVTYGIAFFLVASTAWRIGRDSAPTVSRFDRGPLPCASTRIGCETAVVLCLMLLLSPMSSKAHYVVMVLPTFIIVRIAMERRGAWWAVVAALFATGPMTAKGIVGKPLGDITLLWGLPMIYAVISLVAICVAIPLASRPALLRFPHLSGTKNEIHSGSRDAA